MNLFDRHTEKEKMRKIDEDKRKLTKRLIFSES
jgi:hypothetical protein